MIALVVAMAEGNVIGARNDLPWYLPADLKHFKEITSGHTVIMGRTTFESIIARLHRPLPNRRSVVITRKVEYDYKGVEIMHDVADIAVLAEEVYVIGGAQIYAATINQADKLYVTEVHAAIPGDTYFPTIDPKKWQEVSRESHAADEKNQYDYDFVMYERK
ncbi:dihydrofolate reductase [Candidatus Saccharibacteria bacterium]|nr:dihydrofolate reductase [Candidatus Saccharibacteria bacterium]